MCACEKKTLCIMKKNEVISQYPKDLNDSDQLKSKSKNKGRRNSYQISSKITHFISSNKMDDNEEEINLLNTAKNTFPSNNAMSNAQNMSVVSDFKLNSIQIENNNNNKSDIIPDNNKVDNLFESVSKIEDNNKNDIDKKFLFNKASKNNLEELINMFKREPKFKNNIKDINNDNKFQNIIIDYDGEQCLYNGELDESKKINGQGLIYFINGKKLEGNFMDGKLNGFGKYTDENGTFYEGNFDHGELNGEGKIIRIKENNDISFNSKENIINKITYEGNIKNFKKEGHGKEICAEYTYEGNFHKDMKNGKGKIQFLNTGDSYEGEFTEDKITGYGKYIWSNNHQYLGDFIEGEMNGKGQYKWPDGTEYTGEYVNNIREGEGEFKWSNGAVFKGKFHNGKPNGKGIIVYKGHTLNAEFKNGSFVGDLKSIFKSIKS